MKRLSEISLVLESKFFEYYSKTFISFTLLYNFDKNFDSQIISIKVEFRYRNKPNTFLKEILVIAKRWLNWLKIFEEVHLFNIIYLTAWKMQMFNMTPAGEKICMEYQSGNCSENTINNDLTKCLKGGLHVCHICCQPDHNGEEHPADSDVKKVMLFKDQVLDRMLFPK